MLVFTVFYSEYEFFDSKDYNLPSKAIEEFNENIFKMYSKEYNTSVDTNPFWGFAKQIIVSDSINEASNPTCQTEITQKAGTNILCIASSCYRLLGIHYKNSKVSITLYNKDMKERIKIYNELDFLQDGVVVDKISSYAVDLKDINSGRKWYFKIFDVNQTKYKPKEIEE
jgi:hypothetical protein